MTKEEKAKALDKIAKEIEKCNVCKEDSIGVAVVGEGNPDADVMFIGEAPGKQEAASGRPFIGRSGQLLRKMIRNVGLDDQNDIYITSPVKYLPRRGTPTSKQVAHGKTHFDKQVEIVNPKLMVLMGSVAAQGALGEKIPVKTRHGEVIERNGRKYFITLHPAAGLRFPPLKKLIDEDFAKLQTLLEQQKLV